ncbi:hypothetical protein M427DRAFT_170416 [Gonapodya prolifera JEL478]|uniref:HECT-type E3 ubiquitin transferase n=1 Tax=Gonapodya prolifera (strain JEL478) TaxID=1344416 RepID=A0A139B020_GONPJ|nr:hypothetical protein M427DRAFT_170416 [Gonapodya prolifera JEL478]|eukprot:KXS22342.1 hypothetical protein M427DRAFT_170416 [Gonapodya prolifera JEL478]
MYSFDGDFKRKRQINLGGATKVEDKQVLLRRAAAEREARERERKKQRAATILQSAWRSSCSRADSRELERVPWDENFSKFTSQWSRTPGSALVGELELLVRSFLFFHQQKKDAARLDKLVELILDGERVQGLRPLLAPFLLKYGAQNSPWELQVSKLLRLCLERFRGSQAAEANPASKAVDIAIDYGEWQTLGKLTSVEHVSSLFVSVMSPLYPTLYEILRQHITSGQGSINTIQHAVPALERAMDAAVPHFISQLFTMPHLLTRLPPTATSGLVTFPFPAKIASFLARTNIRIWTSSAGKSSPAEILCILGNLVVVAKAALGSSQPVPNTFLSHLVTSIDSLLSLIPATVLAMEADSSPTGLAAATRRIDDDDDEYDRSAMVSNDVMDVDTVSHPDPAVLKSLSALYDRGFLTALIRHLTMSECGVEAVASLVTALLTGIPHRKSEILTAVVYMPGVSPLRGFYDGIVKSSLWAKCGAGRASTVGVEKVQLSPSIFTDAKYSANIVLLFVLCETYARMLLTMGDDEFFGDAGLKTSGAQPSISTTTTSLRANPLRINEIGSAASCEGFEKSIRAF